ncbi:MAG: NEAT domain-containing protein [Clostridiales Family XIII bacterium]|nr:NEAT domain-containing protein [Clostridiales Family XIII bacterium]
MKLKRVLYMFLIMALLLSGVPTGSVLADQGSGESNSDTVAGLFAPGLYSVPVNFYSGASSFSKEPSEFDNEARVQFNSAALVTAKTDGTYSVTLQFNAYSQISYIQIVKPDKIEEYKQLESALSKIKAGEQNCRSEDLALAKEKNIVSADMNAYYMAYPDIAFSQGEEDKVLDIGYVTFDLPNLTDRLFMKTWSASASGYASFFTDFYVYFSPQSCFELPDNLAYESGDQEFDFFWTNTCVSTNSNIFRRDNAQWIDAFFDAFEPGAEASIENTMSFDVGFTATATVNEIAPVDGKTYPASPSATAKWRYLAEQYVATASSPISIGENGTFTLPYNSKELAFGKWVRVHFADQSASTYHFGRIHLRPKSESETQTGFESENNGVKLIAPPEAINKDTIFRAESKTSDAELFYIDADKFNSFTSLADNGHFRAYALSAEYGGQKVKPNRYVELLFSIPEEWDMERTFLYVFNSGVHGALIGETDEHQRVVAFETADAVTLNSEFLLVEMAQPADLSKLEDGIYLVDIAVVHYGQNTPSMANSALKNNEGYIEVTNGQAQLYTAYQGISVGGDFEYMSDLSYYDDSLSVRKIYPSEHLAYHHTEEGSLQIDDKDNLIYPARIQFPITNPSADGCFWINVIVPIMDIGAGGAPGSGVGAQNARLIISNVRSQSVNALAGYDRTVIRAQLDVANRLLQTLNETDRTLLESAIETAQSIYDSTATLTSEQIKSARDALFSAVEQARVTGEPDESVALDAAIAAAKTLTSNRYTNESFAALTAIIAAAEYARDRGLLTETWIAAQIAALETAVDALAEDIDEAVALEDGDYSLSGKTALWHYSMNQYSMGNNAIDHTRSALKIKDGKAEVRLFFGPLSVGKLQGYLRSLSQMENIMRDSNGGLVSYTLTPAAIYSYYDTKDVYNQDADWNYPKEVGIEVTIGQEYTDVYVNVPIMDELGAGNQPARLRIDWAGFDIGIPNTTALDTAIVAVAGIDPSPWTEESYAALAASIVAGTALKAQPGLTQSMVDKRVAAILAAQAALLATVDPGTDPETPENSVVRTELGAKLTEAGSKTQSDYTEASYNTLLSAIAAAQTVYDDKNATQANVNVQMAALAAAIAGLVLAPTPPPSADSGFALESGDYPTDIKLWHYSFNQASMGNGALAHDQSFVRVKDDGAAEVHLFFEPLTFMGLTGHLEQIWLVTNIEKDESGIITKYDTVSATVISDYGTLKDDYGPINISAYPQEVVLPVEIGKTYTTVEVFVPVMEKAVGGAGKQLARLQIDWSALGVEEKPETPETPGGGVVLEEPPASKAPEVTVTLPKLPESSGDVKEIVSSSGGKAKIIENTVTAEQATEITQQITGKANEIAIAAKQKAAEKLASGAISAGESVVAELRIEAKTLPQGTDINEIKADVTNIPRAAIAAIVAESNKTENANVELLLTVESVFAFNGVEETAAVTFDAAELAALVAEAGDGAVESVSITVVSDARNADVPLSGAQAGAVPAGKVPFAIELAANGVPVTGALASPIAITIPHAAPAAGKKLVVYYVAADGSKTEHAATHKDGKLTFTTDRI